MKCFLWKEQVFFEVNKKEEITDNVYLITDYEHDMIKETLDYSGRLWIEDGEIKWSGKRPDEVHIWDDVSHSWTIDDTLFEARLEAQQEHMWEKIKSKRLQAVTSGVYVESVDKWFHTDEVSVTSYSTIAGMIALNNYEPVQWKVMDNTWLLLTEPLLKELQTAMGAKTNANYEVAEQHKAAMIESTSPLEYDYSEGWV